MKFLDCEVLESSSNESVGSQSVWELQIEQFNVGNSPTLTALRCLCYPLILQRSVVLDAEEEVQVDEGHFYGPDHGSGVHRGRAITIDG